MPLAPPESALGVLSCTWLQAYRPLPNSRARTVLSAYCASVSGAQSQLFLKVISVGLHTIGTGDASAATSPAFIISLLGLAFAAPLQLILLNSTLASSPVGYAVPLYQALLIILTAAAGGIFFREFAHSSVGSSVAFAVGSLVSILGLALLSLKDPGPGGEKIVPGSSEDAPMLVRTLEGAGE